MPPEKEKVQRRQILIDRSFQLQFLRLWVCVGVAIILLSAVTYVLVRRSFDYRAVDPIILRVVLGMGVFILLFCVLMGTFSIVIAHRVAGAAYRIEKSLDRMIEGDFSGTINLRRGDYLTRIAERLNCLQEQVRASSSLSDVRRGLSIQDQLVLDQLIQKSKSSPTV